MKSFLFNFQIDVWTEMAKEMKSNFGPARSKPAGKAGSVIGKGKSSKLWQIINFLFNPQALVVSIGLVMKN